MSNELESGLTATMDHIERMARKRRMLEERQDDAEKQLLHSMAVAFAAGTLEYERVIELGSRFRRAARPGWTKRWNAIMPMSNGAITAWRNRHEANDVDALGNKRWHGFWPVKADVQAPVDGNPVAYVLFDLKGDPIYVGSTQHFRQRMKQHKSSGKPVYEWIAYPCATRNAAYNFESALLDAYMPSQNKRRESRRS